MGKLKRRYLDLRNGQQVIQPVFGFSNFIMLAYITFVENIMPIWLFAVIVTPVIVVSFVLIGHTFRKKQLSTDMDLNYEKAVAAAKTTYHIMHSNYLIMKSSGIEVPQEYVDRMEYMKRIGTNCL